MGMVFKQVALFRNINKLRKDRIGTSHMCSVRAQRFETFYSIDEG